jgi:hypothetical protein
MPRPRIHDEFTNLPISRQAKYRLRMQKAGLCVECGDPAIGGSHCVKHLVLAREKGRVATGARKRYNTRSYRLEAGL